MERIELRIVQETDENCIKVSAKRNEENCFSEEFRCDELHPKPIHTLSPDTIESTTDAVNSASASLITDFLADIEGGKKTCGKVLYGQSQSKFQLTSLIDIKNFEKLANVKFDYSKFNSLKEFQTYFKSLLK